LNPLDRRLGGLPDLSLLGAPAGSGKTAFLLQIAVGVARHHDVNDAVVVFISLDMRRDVIQRRLVSHLSGLDYRVVTQGSVALRGKATGEVAMDEADWQAFAKGFARLADEGIAQRFYILDRRDIGASLTADGLRAIIDDCKARSGCSRAAVFVDYLQLLPGPPPPPMGRWSRAKEVDKLDAEKELVQLVADAIDAPDDVPPWKRDAAVAISETRKRAGGDKDEATQGPEDLMGSNRLTFAPDCIMMLRRMNAADMKTTYGCEKKEAPAQLKHLVSLGVTPLMLEIVKGRDGMFRGEIPLEFEYTRSRIQAVVGAGSMFQEVTYKPHPGTRPMTTTSPGPERPRPPRCPHATLGVVVAAGTAPRNRLRQPRCGDDAPAGSASKAGGGPGRGPGGPAAHVCAAPRPSGPRRRPARRSRGPGGLPAGRDDDGHRGGGGPVEPEGRPELARLRRTGGHGHGDEGLGQGTRMYDGYKLSDTNGPLGPAAT
ncbi:MAG: DnaB-like helicase C-terminal domain-containing protein, partial [Singulisphaera sp.]